VRPEDLLQPPRYVLAENMTGQSWVVDTVGKVVYISDDLDVDAARQKMADASSAYLLHCARPTLVASD
jgi:hypothetical protein